MSKIDKQSVLKSFYLFDQKRLPLKWAAGGTGPELRIRLCEEWLKVFADTEKEIWETATKLALQHCRWFPTEETMRKLIDHAAASRYYARKQAQAQKAPTPRVVRDECLKKMLRLAARGRYNEAKAMTAFLSYEGGGQP